MRVSLGMHPYRGARLVIDDDGDVRAYARRAWRLQWGSRLVVVSAALVIACLVADWPLAWQVLSRGHF